jgi:hypothetical protein
VNERFSLYKKRIHTFCLLFCTKFALYLEWINTIKRVPRLLIILNLFLYMIHDPLYILKFFRVESAQSQGGTKGWMFTPRGLSSSPRRQSLFCRPYFALMLVKPKEEKWTIKMPDKLRARSYICSIAVIGLSFYQHLTFKQKQATSKCTYCDTWRGLVLSSLLAKLWVVRSNPTRVLVGR